MACELVGTTKIGDASTSVYAFFGYEGAASPQIDLDIHGSVRVNLVFLPEQAAEMATVLQRAAAKCGWANPAEEHAGRAVDLLRRVRASLDGSIEDRTTELHAAIIQYLEEIDGSPAAAPGTTEPAPAPSVEETAPDEMPF